MTVINIEKSGTKRGSEWNNEELRILWQKIDMDAGIGKFRVDGFNPMTSFCDVLTIDLPAVSLVIFEIILINFWTQFWDGICGNYNDAAESIDQGVFWQL